MRTRPRPHVAALLLAIASSHCGAKSPAAPTVTTTAVTLSVSGGGSTSLLPGETRQLVALAAQSNGAALDVTTQATWQSSSVAAVTISPSGLVTAVAEGSVDVTARYGTASGTLRVDVRPTCTVTVSPAAASYSAFGGSGTVAVTVNSPSCRWTARSDAAWLPFTLEPANSGSGSFTYTIPSNSTAAARTASLAIETSTGQRVAHAITEDKPLGCSYVTQPEELSFSAAGGTGQFTVITTPSDCRWTLVNGMASLGVSVTSGFSGTGGGLVRYSVQAHTRSVDADGYLEISGLSGLNPNGRHHIVILKR